MDSYCNKLPPSHTKKWELGIILGLFRTPHGEVLNMKESGYLNQIWNISQLILSNCWGRSSGSDQSGLSFDVFVFARQIRKLDWCIYIIIPKPSQKYVLELVSDKMYRKAFCLMGKKCGFRLDVPVKQSITWVFVCFPIRIPRIIPMEFPDHPLPSRLRFQNIHTTGTKNLGKPRWSYPQDSGLPGQPSLVGLVHYDHWLWLL